MSKANTLLTIIALFLFVVCMGSCEGDGGSTGSTPSPPDSPTFDATGIDEEELIVAMGSSSFQPPTTQIKVSNFPQSINLFMETQNIVTDIPWISQIPPCADWDCTANCGPTSYLMIEAFYKGYMLSKDNSEESIKGVINSFADCVHGYTPPWKDGCVYYCGDIPTDSKIAALATNRGGFIAKASVAESMNILIKELQKGHPVIVRVLYQGSNQSDEMIVEGREGHYMVLVGMDDTYVYVNDPGTETETYGKTKKYTIDSFKKAWATPHPDNELL